MSVASEITRLQNAKASLKSSINTKNDENHQITDETLEDYADFVDAIQTGGGDSHNWSAIGYTEEPNDISDGYDYAVQIYNNWENIANLKEKFRHDSKIRFMPLVNTSSATTMQGLFYRSAITYCPLLNTSNVTEMNNMFRETRIRKIPQFVTNSVTDMSYMFNSCYSMETIPQLNTSSVTTMQNMFQNCPNLTDESLNNILKMCININPSYSRAKTLAQLGFTSTYYITSRIQALSEYSNFTSAGWTIGY